MTASPWAVVLAGGDGDRVSAITRDAEGRVVPKQFWCCGGQAPMVRWALARARLIAETPRVLVVVREQHRACWEGALADVPRENILVQPENRGTAAGVMRALVEIQSRAITTAPVVLLPSDHYVADERVLHRCAGGRPQECLPRRPARRAAGYQPHRPGGRLRVDPAGVAGPVRPRAPVRGEASRPAGARDDPRRRPHQQPHPRGAGARAARAHRARVPRQPAGVPAVRARARGGAGGPPALRGPAVHGPVPRRAAALNRLPVGRQGAAVRLERPRDAGAAPEVPGLRRRGTPSQRSPARVRMRAWSRPRRRPGRGPSTCCAAPTARSTRARRQTWRRGPARTTTAAAPGTPRAGGRSRWCTRRRADRGQPPSGANTP